MRKKEVREKASGDKIVYFGNKPYKLIPELKRGMCEGCDLYNGSCPSRITSLCTQGFILKRVIV